MGIAVTVSRQLGAGGENIACKVAEELDLRIVGQEIIHEALNAGVPQDILLESEEGRRNWIQKALDWLDRKQGVPPSPGSLMESDTAYLSTGLLSSDEYYRSVLESIIFDLTQSDDVLLVGRAGQMVFRSQPNSFHIRIVAPLEKRIPVIEKRFNFTPEAAQRKIEDTERARTDYLKRHYDANIDDASLYDLCINTGKIPQEDAVKLIVAAIKAAGLR